MGPVRCFICNFTIPERLTFNNTPHAYSSGAPCGVAYKVVNMEKIKIGDKKHAAEINSSKMSYADIVMAYFDSIDAESQESSLLELKRKQREINEKAKKRF